MMKTLIRSATLAAILLSLGACASILTSSAKPPAIYVLHPRLDGPAHIVAPTVVEVGPPAVPAGFDTDRIALYWNQGRRLDYYAGAQWPAALGGLLQDFIIQSAHGALEGAAFAAPDAGLNAKHRLIVKVVEFQPVYKGAPTGTPDLYVTLKFTLVSLPEQTIEDDFTVTGHRPASSDSLTAIASGLETLTQNALAEAFDRLAGDLRASGPGGANKNRPAASH
jgi:ABC-type uncharacterized transport system auxiliary subunit